MAIILGDYLPPRKTFSCADTLGWYLYSLRGWDDDTWRFFCHIWYCHSTDDNREGVVIPSPFIRRFFRNADVNGLLKEKIIAATEFFLGKCRRFQINSNIRQLGNHLQYLSFLVPHASYNWDLISNKPTKRGRYQRKPCHQIFDENKHGYPAILENAMLAIAPLPWNPPAVLAYLEEKYLDAKDKPYNRKCEEWLRFESVLYWFANLAATELFRVGDIIHSFVVLGVCDTGRLKEVGYGLLNAHKELRRAALSGIPYFNYDIVACHLRILSELTGKRFDMEDFASIKKWEHITTLEIDQLCRGTDYEPEKVWKSLLYSIIFSGGNLNTMPSWEFYFLVEQRHGGMKKKELNEEMRDYFSPVLEAMERLWDQEQGKIAFGRYANAVGVCLEVAKLEPHQEKPKVLAHCIQGWESRIICRLIGKCHQAGIQVISYQYDGLTTMEPIPPEFVAEIIAETKINFMLELKPF